MAYYNKTGLLLLSDDQTKFLVCKKEGLDKWIIPGGKFEKDEDDINCLKREIKEELNVGIDENSLRFVGEYVDISADNSSKDILIRLYQIETIGTPKPSAEINALHWIGRGDIKNLKVTPITRNKIIPDLIKRKILK